MEKDLIVRTLLFRLCYSGDPFDADKLRNKERILLTDREAGLLELHKEYCSAIEEAGAGKVASVPYASPNLVTMKTGEDMSEFLTVEGPFEKKTTVTKLIFFKKEVTSEIYKYAFKPILQEARKELETVLFGFGVKEIKLSLMKYTDSWQRITYWDGEEAYGPSVPTGETLISCEIISSDAPLGEVHAHLVQYLKDTYQISVDFDDETYCARYKMFWPKW